MKSTQPECTVDVLGRATEPQFPYPCSLKVSPDKRAHRKFGFGRIDVDNRWDEKAGLWRDAVRSQDKGIYEVGFAG
jgi:hypothetical protein